MIIHERYIVTGLDGNLTTGPMQLDQEVIHRRAQELFDEVEHENGAATGAESQEGVATEELSHAKQENERGKRLSKRPSWLRDFIMCARS